MNAHTPATSFSADRPIESSADDRLNRRDFAFALGDSVISWDGKDSLVIGLNGAWGSGKTSVINLILERTSAAKPAPHIIRFNPWEWSGHEELATAFFREIEVALKIRKTPEGSQLAEQFEQYARILKAGATLADSIAPITLAASTILVVAGGATIAVDQVLGGGALLVIGALGIIASQVGRFTQAVGLALRRPRAPKSLTEAKSEMVKTLQKYDRNIFVVVDDLDRLTPPDAVRILQLVKANADFPRMVYLLAYDLAGLGNSVQAALQVDGSDYVDKIVQVPIHVPKPDKSALEDILLEKLNRILEPASIQGMFVKDRWHSLFLDVMGTRGINWHFSTPRRILRFISALDFDLSRHLDRGACNVDPVDFIGIETLRVFEPVAYDAVFSEKRLLTGSAIGDSQEQERATMAVNSILEKASEGPRRSVAEHVLRELFPSAVWALTGTQIGGDAGRLLADRRVSHPDMFDFYFQMAVPSASLSEGEIQEVVAATSESREALTDALRVLAERGRIRPFLRDLAAGLERIPMGQERAFISSLFDIGDELEAQVERMLDVSDTLRAEFLIEDLLKRLPQDERLGALEEAVADSEGVALPLSLIRLELQRGDRGTQPTIQDEEGLSGLGQRLLERVRGLASDERLLNHRHLAEVMFAWSFFGGTDDVKRWAEEQAATPGGLLRLFQAFVRYKGPNNAHPLSEYIDLDDAIARVEDWLASEDLAPATAEGLRAALTAVRERYGP